MNKSKLVLVGVLTAVIELMAIQSTWAQDLFNASLKVLCISTNQSGNLVYQPFGTSNLISQCATEQGLTNVSQLSLVYNLASNALEVVTSTNNPEIGSNYTLVGSNQVVVCTPLTFMDIVSLTGTNTNKVELLASVFVETNTTASGTLAATEHFGTTTNSSGSNTTSFSLIGRIQYAVTASGTNSPAIYRGVLLVGVGANDQDEENNESGEHGNQGNNGNHGNGNNGNHRNGNNGNHGNGNNGNHGNGNNGNGNGNKGPHGK